MRFRCVSSVILGSVNLSWIEQAFVMRATQNYGQHRQINELIYIHDVKSLYKHPINSLRRAVLRWGFGFGRAIDVEIQI